MLHPQEWAAAPWLTHVSAPAKNSPFHENVIAKVLYGDIGAFNQVKRRRREVKPAQGPRIADRVADIVLRNLEYNRVEPIK